MVGVRGSAESCLGSKDLAGAGSCCMNPSSVSIFDFDI